MELIHVCTVSEGVKNIVLLIHLPELNQTESQCRLIMFCSPHTLYKIHSLERKPANQKVKSIFYFTQKISVSYQVSVFTDLPPLSLLN